MDCTFQVSRYISIMAFLLQFAFDSDTAWRISLNRKQRSPLRISINMFRLISGIIRRPHEKGTSSLLSAGIAIFPEGEVDMDIQVLCNAFHQGEVIPVQYTCDGNNVSPSLRWGSIPKDAQSLALICEDPGAPSGVFVHWLIFNLSPIVADLPEALPTTGILEESGASQGRNDFNNIGYDGPCPPPGNFHRYFFRLYALDTKLPLQEGAKKDELARAMEGHILATGQLMGTYKRRASQADG
jgi:Raf kinase inhibitor-like YbhB/YbcL family protein